MYFNIDLQTKMEVNSGECWKRLDSFTKALEGSISNLIAARKETEIQLSVLM
jgi:hypothetical protein